MKKAIKKAIYVVLCTIIAIGLSFNTISVFAENDETITNVSKGEHEIVTEISKDSNKSQNNDAVVDKTTNEENKAVGGEEQNKNLKPLQSPPLKADPVSTKTFTVTKYPVADSSNETLVGEYDTFYKAIEACKQEDLSNQYVVTMNNDCNIPATEQSWGKSSVNILLKSREGHTFTLKRLGNRDIMTVYSKCTFRIENVILDGNNDGQACMVAGGDDPDVAQLILGKGAVIQNFKDHEGYLGTTFYLAEGNSILTIEDGAVLQNNTAKESGGIIQARAKTTINIKGGSFKNNSSESGGGVLFTNGKLNITGGTFENNQGKYGGALWIGSKSTETVENATFRNNKTTSSYGGGAIWGSNEFKVKNSTFEKNQQNQPVGWGGAIYSVKNMTIEGSTFKENEANVGGALAIHDGMKMTVKDSKFIGNSATFAGAISIGASTEESTMSGCTFTENEATKKGAAIWSKNAPISIEDSTFENNGKGTLYGGGLCVNGDKTYNVKNSIFKGNQAKLGGGIFVAGGKLSVEETTLESNIAAKTGGAILSLKDEDINSEMVISKSLIKNNEAPNGAGVTVQSGKVEIKDTEFNGNDTKGPENDQDKRLGGALYVDVDANVNISEASKFIGNKAGLGGAIFDASADYSNPADKSKYQNLKIDATTLFKGNEARTGLHQPPTNFEKFDNLLFSDKSDVPHDKYMSKSLLNNYDINYQGGLLITYDANGGKFTDGKSIKQKLHKENDTIKIIEAPMREGYQFLYWKGSKYNPGDSYIVKDSHTFVAQWNKIPELEVKDATITKGESLDLMSLVVKAMDEEDGDLTKDVKIINNGGFDKDKVGEYTVTFEVKDSNGATAKATAKVTVKEKVVKPDPQEPAKPDPQKPAKPEPKPDHKYYYYVKTGEPILNIDDHYAYMKGYPDKTFGPDKPMTRAEVTMMFARLLKERPEKDKKYIMPYKDIHENDWYAYAVTFMSEKKLVSGYPDGTFKPNAPITRAEFASIASRFDSLADKADLKFSDVSKNHWAYKVICSAEVKGWISGYPDGTFKPEKNITRAEVVSSTNRILNRYADLDFAKAHVQELAPMIDMDDSHWAYGPVVEAVNGHDYKRLSDGKSERWIRLNGKRFTFPLPPYGEEK